LLRYNQKDIVDPELETTSSIVTLKVRAFTASDAHQINEKLLELSEQLVNKMNARAADDSIEFAQRQADLAAERVKNTAIELAKYRTAHTVFDPERQSALQLQQVAGLQAQLFAAQSQLAQIQSVSPDNPQVSALNTNIATIQKQIDSASGGITGDKGSRCTLLSHVANA
jgi:capsular polysaccharide transport system permease protein